MGNYPVKMYLKVKECYLCEIVFLGSYSRKRGELAPLSYPAEPSESF